MARINQPSKASSSSPAAQPGSSTTASQQFADDRQLVVSLRRGDEAAFGWLLDRYHSSMVRLAMSFVPGRELAEEVVQETWLGVLEGVDRFEGRSSLKTWIFRILVNKAKTRGVRESRTVSLSPHRFADGDTEDAAVDPSQFVGEGPAHGHWTRLPRRWDVDTPEKILLNSEARKYLEQAIEALPPQQQQVITMRDIEGLTSEEICNVLDISETNQRVLLHRARSKVRQALEKYLESESRRVR